MSFLRLAMIGFLMHATGCASASFNLADGDAGAASDGGGSTDAGGTGGDAGSVGSSDGGGPTPSDGGGPGPGCESTVPSVTCAEGVYAEQFNLAAMPGGVTLEPLSPKTSYAVSFVQAKAGRTEKIHLRLPRVEVDSAASTGTVRVSAFYVPCEGVLVPLGVNNKPATDVNGEYSFYFNPSAGGGPYLPWLPAGARLAFVVETDSNRYRWNLGTTAAPLPNPQQFQLGVRSGSTGWVGVPGRIAAAMSYLRNCAG